MKAFSTAVTGMALISAASASTIVRWFGCAPNQYQQTISDGEGGCTNVGGFLSDNLCKVVIPAPGTDYCKFYSTACYNPFPGDEYTCKVSDGECDASGWNAIASYECWTK
ncbi:hypothetical protein ASPVEDRAFT_23254 [Aspergillus versicolor CBS 583.65]|uniref:Ig-like domain-containing protein n=1 Tax=Aspergillus versicolor CBS 583.65 TaxID=1036611 RepID=A0A1L9P498_ASPVE|nr:uncharacterized protein ASPVEDRAFT_23254 [Aspergillus versicolor CBS 583.65]OJI96233.1 hypothetical protein ASPVEDRAFT_23254 [Aspergillus versicolor CBS 583.65]